MNLRPLIFAALALGACRLSTPAPLTLLVPAEHEALAREATRFVPLEGLAVETSARPAEALRTQTGLAVAWVQDDSCGECFSLSRDGLRVTVSAGGPLGLQYGLYAVLEELGFRFHHPWRTHVPASLTLPDDSTAFGQLQSPQTERRGLHLHTLHPIEALYDLWMPSEAGLEGALRTLDFVVKNRGNQLMWFGLDDIQRDAARAEAWRAHTAAILDAAHARGVRVALKIQLFGHSNLQNAFDLVDGTPGAPDSAELERRLHVLLDGLPFDTLNLTFGEFFGTDPTLFVQNIDAAYAALQKVAPGTEMTTMIHVGNRPEQQVSYRGETLQQYFLVKYANPAIVPWVHTVMYFDLFEPALGAYGHAEFDAHRAFLLERLRAGRPVGYFPEASYWVAFDSSVPLFLPLYLRSRHLDLARLAEEAAAANAPRLREHILFSSGWEWGYWLTDVAVLRMGWSLPERWSDPVRWAFAPWGEHGRALAEHIDALGEVQHRALMKEGLSPWLAGRDQILDYGRGQNIVSQPDRLEYSDIARLSPSARADFDAHVLAPLGRLATETEALAAEVEALGLDLTDPFLAEARDAFAITALRARWAHTAVLAARTHGDGREVAPALAQLDALLAKARTVVSRRRDGMHDPDPKSLLRNNLNPSLYQYGYLREADTLCYWQRERAQLRNLVLQSGEVVPGCVL